MSPTRPGHHASKAAKGKKVDYRSLQAAIVEKIYDTFDFAEVRALFELEPATLRECAAALPDYKQERLTESLNKHVETRLVEAIRAEAGYAREKPEYNPANVNYMLEGLFPNWMTGNAATKAMNDIDALVSDELAAAKAKAPRSGQTR